MPMTALATQFIEGKDYQTVASAQLSANKDKTPLITEFLVMAVHGVIKLMPH